VRVGVNLLGQLMTLVGELVLARNRCFNCKYAGKHGLAHRIAAHESYATELQEQVMKTRMQPIGNIWAQFPRNSARCRTRCGKQVNIQWRQETELDKTIIEPSRTRLRICAQLGRPWHRDSRKSCESRKGPGRQLDTPRLHEGGRSLLKLAMMRRLEPGAHPAEGDRSWADYG